MKIGNIKSKVNKKKAFKIKTSEVLNFVGNILIASSLILLVMTLGPVATQEVKYSTRSVVKNVTKTEDVKKEIEPPNKDFSIVIPKIEAVAPVFANIDPYNEKEYLGVLKKGVAHAKGSALPGEDGNVYIFAHSTDAFYNVGRYNAVFYLLGKLENGDEVDVYYKDKKIIYRVLETKVVSAAAIKYLGDLKMGKSLTLQTCYPPGTTLKRLIVVAIQIN
jgi:LPXTG-site transpeptidase (sortase) family protein